MRTASHPATADEEAHLQRHSLDFDDDEGEDVAPLLPESDLMVEQLRNELESDLAGADGYERKFIPWMGGKRDTKERRPKQDRE